MGDVPTESWLEPSPTEPLNGEERLGGTSATVADFWTWAFSDLRMNIVRGVLAEFLVAKAVGAKEPVRVAWDNWDVVSASGVSIEVKSSAYLQSWPQRKHSTISFTGLSARRWDAKEGFGDDREVRADVFVFAIQTCREPASYDALDVRQWRFHVVPASIVRRHGTRSVGIGFLERHAPDPVPFEQLPAAVDAAANADSAEGRPSGP